MTVLHAGGKFGGGGYAVSGGLHGVGISVVNALVQPGRHRGPPPGLRLAAVLRRRRHAAGRPRRGEETDRDRHDQTFWPEPDIFETIEFDFETLRARFQQMAFLNKGLTHHADRRAPPGSPPTSEDVDLDAVATEVGVPRRAPHSVVYQYDDGLVDYVKHLNSAQEGGGRPPRGHRLRVRGHRAQDLARDRDAVDHALLRERPHLREHHQHPRGRHPRRGLPRGADHADQPLRAGEGPPQGEGRQPHRRRHPRGPDRRHLDQAGRAPVRGPDQDQARQHRGQGVRAEGRHATGSATGWSAIPAPARDVIRKAIQAPPARMAARKARETHPPQGPAGVRRHARQAHRLLARRTRAIARSSSSRATRPAAPPCAAATRRPRRSCRCAARS